MPGFNMGMPQQQHSAAPFQMISPEMLAQLAAQGFRPPGMGGGGAPGFQMPTGGGMDMASGMAGLGAGLGALGKGGGDIFAAKDRTAGDGDLNGYGGSPVDPMSGNPNAQPVEVFNPTGAVSGGGFGAVWDFLTGRR